MNSADIKKVADDLDKFLAIRHPSSVLQFITGMMVEWTHFDRTKPPGKSDIDLAWNRYLNRVRNNIDKRLSLISVKSHSNKRKKIFWIPLHIYERKKLDETINILSGMSPDEALDFMGEVTVNWCFSVPIKFLQLEPLHFHGTGDEAVANAIYEWLVRYFDLWP